MSERTIATPEANEQRLTVKRPVRAPYGAASTSGRLACLPVHGGTCGVTQWRSVEVAMRVVIRVLAGLVGLGSLGWLLAATIRIIREEGTPGRALAGSSASHSF